MADAVSLTTLLAKCAERGEISLNYWSEAVQIRAINDAITEMWDRILATPNGRDFLLRPSHLLAIAVSRSGTGDSIAITGTTCTLTDSAGAFLATEVGATLNITGCTNSKNDGTFIITSRTSTTVVYENADGVAETTALTWTIDNMTVGLPTDYGVDVEMVEVKETDNSFRQLEPFNLFDRHDDNVGTVSQRVETKYRVVGNHLLLSPPPSWAGSLRVWYVPRPVDLATGTDTHEFFFGWDRFVVNKVCQMHARARGEHDDANSFLQDALLALDGILGRAMRRTAAAGSVRDVYGERRRNRYPQVT